MFSRIQILLFIAAISLVVIMPGCHRHRPDPPDNWIQKVNNQQIARIVLDNQIRNCASTVKKHVICTPYLDTLENACAIIVTFNNGTPRERWAKDCPIVGSDTLVFDDGQFSYFYGTKSNP